MIAADLAPPITTVFLFGVFWRRGTKEASIITLITGFLIGALSFVLDLAGLRNGKAHHSWPGDFIHDASLVGVLHLQHDICCRQPAHSCAASGTD